MSKHSFNASIKIKLGTGCKKLIIRAMVNISDRLKQLQDNIADACARSSRSPEEITTVIVTKNTSFDAVKQVIESGYNNLGENRVQHLKQVSEEIAEYLAARQEDQNLSDQIKWHMIGHLQRNKVKSVLKMLSLIHSLDTLRLAEEINTAAEKLKVRPDVLLQVNCSGEPQKYGVPVGAAVHLAEQIVTMPNLKLVGLMTMAPLTKNKDVVRACFARGREIFEEIRAERTTGKYFHQLSMGMSSDYEVAIEEGANILRIGSAVFA